MSRRINTKEYATLILDKVREVLTTDRFKAFLSAPDTLQAFREEVLGLAPYSMHNRITLALFGARAVAGYATWRSLGYQVRRGGKGIPIYRPLIARPKEEEESCDPEERRLLGFNVAYVFDISQVDPAEGEEAETNRAKVSAFFQRREKHGLCAELQGGSEDRSAMLLEWSRTQYPVRFQAIAVGPKGFTNGSEITIREGMSPAQTMKTLLHELAHCRLKHPKSKLDRNAQEIQAESAAFIASARLGLDTGSYSFDYLAAWGNELLKVEDGASRFQEITGLAIEEGAIMAREFKTWQEKRQPVPVPSPQIGMIA